jgi:hypothetical protein
MSISSDRSDDPRRSDAPVPLATDAGSRGQRRALAAVADALCAKTLSMDAVRDAAVRYGSAARVLALAPDEMAGALRALLRRCTERHAPSVRAELEASVPWWAIHGYHRAD